MRLRHHRLPKRNNPMVKISRRLPVELNWCQDLFRSPSPKSWQPPALPHHTDTVSMSLEVWIEKMRPIRGACPKCRSKSQKAESSCHIPKQGLWILAGTYPTRNLRGCLGLDKAIPPGEDNLPAHKTRKVPWTKLATASLAIDDTGRQLNGGFGNGSPVKKIISTLTA